MRALLVKRQCLRERPSLANRSQRMLSAHLPGQYAAYLAVHGACCFAGTLLNALWFNSCILHTAYVLAVLGVSMWNGASYTFHVFAQRYMQVSGTEEVESARISQ